MYHQARTAHLERLHGAAGTTLLFQHARYDFHPEAAAGADVRQVSAVQAFRLILQGAPRTVEITEPTYYPGVRLAAAVVLAARATALLHRRPRPRVVTYAIGNSDPREDFRPVTARERLGYAVNHALAGLVWRSCDRIAFGTGAASTQYRRVFRRAPRGQRRVVIPALPAPCRCGQPAPRARHLVFLGSLTPRKGFDLLLRAWAEIPDPAVRLTIIGSGPGLRDAQALAAHDPRVRVLEDPPRKRIHQVLRSAAVLVLPSQRTARWREQVGLPIVEALAHGNRVVTTAETGLTPWLRTHGHLVLPADVGPSPLARALESALAHPPDPHRVLRTLPVRDGRQVAEDWLIADDEPRDR
ncbi:glycosyltransferase family 4 protein [Serinibacter salmoneus]|uniref:glycosyltransferase family 4 protein n=1 Tax=Serinibacter salmoneus TaxID=556530 RepID=UPI001473CBFC|nr:glycosyltransferase family 4 protein [Serinibacter salmoneus]